MSQRRACGVRPGSAISRVTQRARPVQRGRRGQRRVVERSGQKQWDGHQVRPGGSRPPNRTARGGFAVLEPYLGPRQPTQVPESSEASTDPSRHHWLKSMISSDSTLLSPTFPYLDLILLVYHAPTNLRPDPWIRCDAQIICAPNAITLPRHFEIDGGELNDVRGDFNQQINCHGDSGPCSRVQSAVKNHVRPEAFHNSSARIPQDATRWMAPRGRANLQSADSSRDISSGRKPRSEQFLHQKLNRRSTAAFRDSCTVIGVGGSWFE
ncbi:hypothetical protein BD779DRAFT_1477261 [Infundibulicybe gibba]|nr:hypothetical protein BD779DRAFT_1477261 [Infundibulicybe gibba]